MDVPRPPSPLTDLSATLKRTKFLCGPPQRTTENARTELSMASTALATKAFNPEKWVAPEGAKSEEAAAEGPCEYEPPEEVAYEVKKEDRACMDHKGDKWWLVDRKKTNQADKAGCLKQCQKMPGAHYFTFWGTPGENAPEDVQLKLKIHKPTAYRIKF